VPFLAYEQATIDSLKQLKADGLKVILYIAGNGPSARGGTSDNAAYKAAWENYYQTEGISEAQAWRTLIKGFVERFHTAGLNGESLVGGFWIDHVIALPGDADDFVATNALINHSSIRAPSSTISPKRGARSFVPNSKHCSTI
jgi:hypothetical protein